ncbi:MAG: zf-HC2 domain-containing protein, partial [Acidobacteriota bacterium]
MINGFHDFNELECPSYEIAAYIDGELDAGREHELEIHFAECQLCSVELTQQKQFLCGLSSSLRSEGEIELPAD